ncbi:MAG: succinate dehydrogenase, cytochrome b556 subunit [Nocardioides sp.]
MLGLPSRHRRTGPKPLTAAQRARVRRNPLASSPAGTLYRGREGMWSWVAHRITGVMLFFFLFVHVIDTAMVRVSPEAYNTAVETYKNPIVGLMEVGLVAAVLFHALNGIRVILVDFWANGPRFQKQMTYGVIGLWVVLMVPFVIRHLSNVFGGGH